VNLSQTPSKKFDTAPASSPRNQYTEFKSATNHSSRTESDYDDEESSEKYSPEVESPSKRLRIYENETTSAKKISSPDYNKPMPVVKPFE
jgi:hypothetical protein